MEQKMILKGRRINGGIAAGKALVSKMPFGFTHGVDPLTGDITDVRHDLKGHNLKDKILVFPYGKSSTSGALYILEAVRCGNGPAALINVETEPVIGAGFILADLIYKKRIPVIDRLEQDPTEAIRTGDYVKVDGDRGTVEVIKQGQ